jgi:hypothetical protein
MTRHRSDGARRRTVFAAGLGLLLATACSSPSASSKAMSAGQVTGEGPCRLLFTSEVQSVFAKTAAGRLDRSKEQYGVLSCLWDHPAGRLSIIEGSDAPQPIEAEASGWALTFLDPLRDEAARKVRYATLPGVGDAAIAVVEREDRAIGFIRDGAFLVVRRGRRQVTLFAADLARRDRGAAIAAFELLGKAVAKRLE